MAIVWFEGFEHGVVGDVPSGTGGLWSETTWASQMSATTTPTPPSGTYAARFNATGGAYNSFLRWNDSSGTQPHAMMGTGIAQFVVQMKFRVAALGGTTTNLLVTFNGPSFSQQQIRVTPGGALRLYDSVADTEYSDDEYSISTGVWYTLDYRIVHDSGGNTIDWAVDGSARTQRTFTYVSGNDVANLMIGNVAAISGWDFYIDDIVVANATGDYPLGDRKVLGYSPNGVGSHSIDVDSGSSGYFLTDSGALSLPDTTSYQRLDDVPLGAGTDYVGVAPATSVEIDPDADVTTTGWTTTPLWSKVNDDSDGTYITATAS